MRTALPIIAGGGWSKTRREKVKVRAWACFHAAILSGALAEGHPAETSLYGLVPAFLFALASGALFIFERPTDAAFAGETSCDPRNLYSGNRTRMARSRGGLETIVFLLVLDRAFFGETEKEDEHEQEEAVCFSSRHSNRTRSS